MIAQNFIYAICNQQLYAVIYLLDLLRNFKTTATV